MPASHPIARFGDERLPARFWDKAHPMEDGCWLWSGFINRGGYAHFSASHTVCVRAHRLAYEVLVGQITEETLDHLCRQPSCVNPNHLEPVSYAENVLRGTGLAAMNARKVSCKRGHALLGYNLVITGQGNRSCRTCGVMRTRARRAAEKSRRLVCE
jgi:HNH endonuclease